MPTPSPIARLTDIIEAVELIRGELAGMTLQSLEFDKRKRWLVERGIEIISEASRHLSEDLKARHPEIPRSKVAGIGNVQRHEYERVAYDVLWRVVRTTYRPWRRPAARSWRGNKPLRGKLAKRDLLELDASVPSTSKVASRLCRILPKHALVK